MERGPALTKLCAVAMLLVASSSLAAQTAADAGVGFRVQSRALAVTPIGLDVSRFAFTAPGRADAERAAPNRGPVLERGFTFTPSRSPKSSLSLGMTMRTLVPSAAGRVATDTAAAPNAYDFDLSLGYRGFALSGGASHLDTGIAGGSREGVDVGIGYGTRNWRAGVQASSESDTVSLLPRPEGDSQRYTVEARGALDLSRKVSVGGTLRYRPAAQNPTLLDPQRDDRAVIVGGAVIF